MVFVRSCVCCVPSVGCCGGGDLCGDVHKGNPDTGTSSVFVAHHNPDFGTVFELSACTFFYAVAVVFATPILPFVFGPQNVRHDLLDNS